MKWNYETNLPVKGSYKRIAHNPIRVKEILKEYEQMAGTLEMAPLIESVNYDPDEFLLKKLYKKIPDVVDAQFITLLAFQFDNKPFLVNYFYDIANGFWDISGFIRGYCWHQTNEPVHDIDIITRLYFADSEKDIWDMVYDLPKAVGFNLSSLYKGFLSVYGSCLKNLDKAVEMEEYLDRLSPTKNIEIIIGHHHIIGQVRLLKEDCVIVSLDKPIRHSVCVSVPGKIRGKVIFMTEKDGYRLTNAGEDNAITTLRQLYHEEKDILSDLDKVKAMLADFHHRESERLKKWGSIMSKQARQNGAITTDELLNQIQYEYYPDLRRIEFDEDFVKRLEEKIMDK